MTRFAPALVTSALALTMGIPAHAEVVNFSAPDFDRWNYPFNGTPGIRSLAPTFGAVGIPGAFDDRDGQFLIGFDTSAALPTLGPGQNYQVNAVTVTATHSTGGFVYDPSYDSFETYDGTTTDTDTGRPITLTATGLRSGYTNFGFGATIPGPPTYTESEAFGLGNPAGESVRSAFAAAFDPSGNLIDVSNNVTDGFDFNPFAVGTTNLTPGSNVAEATPGSTPGSTFTFDLNLTDALILGYIQQGIDDGGLFFSLSSLHGASQSGGTSPNFYTSDNFDPAAVAPTLAIDFTVVPEPTAIALMGLGLPLLLRRKRGVS